MTATGSDAFAPPPELLAALRALPTRTPDQQSNVATRWGLRALAGGRNNDVYACRAGAIEICIKIYRKRDDRRRAEREWRALSLLERHAVEHAPIPLWRDDHADQPTVIGMTLVPGRPVPHWTDPATQFRSLTAIARATRAIQAVPLREPFTALERIDSISHYMTRLTDAWPHQLADQASAQPDDPLTNQMLHLLHQWDSSGDAKLLSKPANRVFSRGDSNLLNWHRHHTGTYCVDFEFAGHSDTAVDAADHTEHISARAFPDHMWRALEADLGIGQHNRARFHAAQRTIALRWLAVLWKQRTQRPDEFAAQHQRARNLFS